MLINRKLCLYNLILTDHNEAENRDNEHVFCLILGVNAKVRGHMTHPDNVSTLHCVNGVEKVEEWLHICFSNLV